MQEAARAVQVGERSTWERFCYLYPDEWVTLVEIDWVNETDFEFRSALAISHSSQRADALAQAKPLLDRYDEFGCFFTGKIPPLPHGLSIS